MTAMETLRAAAADVRDKPLALLAGSVAFSLWWVLFYWWLGLPLSGFAGMAAVVVGGMVLAGAAGVMGRQSLTLYRVDDGKAGRLPLSGAFWLGAALFALAGVAAPWWLIYWVPGVSGLAAQAASAALRFAVAVLLFVTAWLMLCAVIRRVMESHGDGEDS